MSLLHNRGGAAVLALALCSAGCEQTRMDENQLARSGAQLASEIYSADFNDGSVPLFTQGNCSVSSAAASAGAYGLRCDDTSMATHTVSTVGFGDITLDYAVRVARYDAGETLRVEVSPNGSAWQTLQTLTGTTGYASQSVALGPEYNDATLLFRFVASANGFLEYFDLDELVVRGTSLAGGDATCDGIDDDVDGSIDEDYLETTTTCGIGACSDTGLLQCDLGVELDTCVPGVPAINDSTCDGMDDDCDGIVDEDCQVTGVTVFEDALESTLDAYEVSGACVISTAAASSGSRGVRCDDTASLTLTVSTVGVRDLVLSYDRRVERYDSGELLSVEVSRNGQAWIPVEVTGNRSYGTASFPLDASMADQSALRVRFSSNANGFYERFDLDNIRLVGDADGQNRVRMQPQASDFFGMPWPSDHRRRANGSPDLSGFPGVDRGLGGSGAMVRDNIEQSVDGFGTTTAVFFTMEGALNPATLPEAIDTVDPGASVMLVNLSDPNAGRIPVLVDMKGAPTAARPGRLLTVMPHPGFSLSPNTTYAAILFDDLQGLTTNLSRAPLLDQLAAGNQAASGLDSADFALLQSHKAQVDAYVAGHTTHSPSQVATFAVYTTQTVDRAWQAAVASLFDLSDAEVLARVSDFAQVQACAANCSDPQQPYCSAARFEARVQMPMFQTAPDFQADMPCVLADGNACMSTSGGGFVVGADGRAQIQSWQPDVAMQILVPCVSQPANGWPAIFFANGTGGDEYSATRVEGFFNITPSSGAQSRLSLNHVVASIVPHQSGPRRDAAFASKITPLFQALTGQTDIESDLNGYVYAFEFNPQFARSNNIQNAADALYAKRVMLQLEQIASRFGVNAASAGLPAGGFAVNADRTTLQGQSQGSHSAPLVLSVPPSAGGFHNAFLNASGGEIFFERAVHRPDLRPLVEQVFKLDVGELDHFHPILHMVQTGKEPGASVNYAGQVAAPGNLFITNGWYDGCSVHESTAAVATAMVDNGLIEVANTAVAFQAAGLPVPEIPGVQTVLQAPLVPFGSNGIQGNLNGATRAFLMLERQHYGSGAGHAVGRYLHDLGTGVVPRIVPPPYDDGSGSGGGLCGVPRVD